MIHNLLFIIIGLGFGAALTAAIMFRRQIALERQNADLCAQIRAGKNALDSATQALDARFKATAQEALSKTSEQFMQLAQEKFKNAQQDGAHDLDKRQRAIDEMIKPVHKHLEALNQALEQVKGTDQAIRNDLQTLNRETARLVGALRDPAAQGKWGEFILEGLLEKSGLIKGVHYETQVSMHAEGSRQRPDAVIHMQDGFNIIIDAKAPLNEFTQRLDTNLSEEEYQTIMKNIARQVREHVKALGKKGYWENIDSPDFTVMFLPSEHLYSLALRADPDIVDFAAQQNIIIASPTLLMSLIRVVGMSWRQMELAQNAQEISERGYELYKRMLTFTGHMEKVGKNIGAALRGYNDAIGSFERSVLPAARKFKDLQGSTASTAEITLSEQSNEIPRALQLTDEDHDEKKANEA